MDKVNVDSYRSHAQCASCRCRRLHVRFPRAAVVGSAVTPPASEKRDSTSKRPTGNLFWSLLRSEIPRVTAWPASAHGTEHEEREALATLAYLHVVPQIAAFFFIPGTCNTGHTKTPCLFLSRSSWGHAHEHINENKTKDYEEDP
jgi:hypothetical protein